MSHQSTKLENQTQEKWNLERTLELTEYNPHLSGVKKRTHKKFTTFLISHSKLVHEWDQKPRILIPGLFDHQALIIVQYCTL